MTTEEALKRAETILRRWDEAIASPRPGWIDLTLDRADLPVAAAALVDAGWGYLASISALDLGEELGLIEVIYHFCEGPTIVNLRVRVNYNDAVIPSITAFMPAALLFEQEASEMLGVTFTGMPFDGYLFLPDEWPQGVYPLRKSFQSPAVAAAATASAIES